MNQKNVRRILKIAQCGVLLWFLFLTPTFAQDNEGRAALWARFRELSKIPCGQREEAVKIGKRILARFPDDEYFKAGNDSIREQIQTMESNDRECRNPDSLLVLYEKFKALRKERCGKRDEAVRIGRRILESYGNDLDNGQVIDFVKKDIARIEKEEESCRRTTPRNPVELIELSKEIIAREGDSPFTLDIQLTMIRTGYELTVIEKNDALNEDTIAYAKLAIQKIEAGQQSQTGIWGIFAPFDTKENALVWMNYIIGYILFNRQNQKNEALIYFDKAKTLESDLNFRRH